MQSTTWFQIKVTSLTWYSCSSLDKLTASSTVMWRSTKVRGRMTDFKTLTILSIPAHMHAAVVSRTAIGVESSLSTRRFPWYPDYRTHCVTNRSHLCKALQPGLCRRSLSNFGWMELKQEPETWVPVPHPSLRGKRVVQIIQWFPVFNGPIILDP